MKITDAAVQAALEYYSEGGCMGLDENERREVTESMLSAALPHLHIVDVAAVQATALIELLHDMRFRLENMGSTDDTDAELVERIMTHVDHIRALSAEPVQEETS